MKNLLSVLIVDDVHLVLLERFDALSVEYSYQPNIKPEDISSELAKYSGIVLRSKLKLTAEFLSEQPQLKLIARAGSGMDNIDVEFANKNGIVCLNAPEANANAVGEQTVGMMLALQHRIVKSNREVKDLTWDREGNRGVELGKATIGIIGYGNTGRSVAQKLKGFGSKVLAYDKYKSGFETSDVEESSLEKIMEVADIISFHIPLNQETTNWINKSWISKLKPGVAILNLSRGGIMNTEAIIDGLKIGKIQALATDVLENESLNSLSRIEREELDWLNSQDNVIITPHIGGWTKESYVGISNVLADKIEAIMKTGINKANATEMSALFVV